MCSEANQEGDILQRFRDRMNQEGAKTVATDYYQEQATDGLGGVFITGMRHFPTGATRSGDDGKNDYEGFLSPVVLEVFGDYMTKHRKQADGQLRDSDNWQKGIPVKQYVKSLIRHAVDLWMLNRGRVPKRLAMEMPGYTISAMKQEAACALFFNVQGYIFEQEKALWTS